MAVVGPLLKQKRTCIQAGGCFGVWPVYFASMFQSVITFEPEPVNYKCLVQNTSHLNNVRCVHAALWRNSTERVGLGLDRKMHNNSGAYFVKGGGEIPTAMIDDLGVTDCDFLALDIEGAEYEALWGGAETINRCRPVIAVEDKGHDQRVKRGSPVTNAIVLLCCEFGYREVDRPTKWDVVLV
jgi:FkbM family methyltransferase